jgi:hypothetical protein
MQAIEMVRLFFMARALRWWGSARRIKPVCVKANGYIGGDHRNFRKNGIKNGY